MQKIGGMEALDTPYLDTAVPHHVPEAGRLAVRAFPRRDAHRHAMGFFEKEIARAVVLALFIPLIISSGGNSGSQATTLVIRAMALGEVRPRHWWRVSEENCFPESALAPCLCAIGMTRILDLAWSFWRLRRTLCARRH